MGYNSVILTFGVMLFDKLREFFNHSFAAFLLDRLVLRAKNLFSNSFVWNFFRRNDYFSKTWHNSVFFSATQAVLNMPSRFFRRLYLKLQRLLENSIIFKIVNAISDRFIVITGVSLVLIILIPESRWSNKYSVVVLCALILLFFVKTVVNENYRFNLKAMDFIFVVFIITFLLSAATFFLPNTSLKYLILYAVEFLFLLTIVSSVKTEKELDILLKIILAGVAAVGLYGIWQFKVSGVPVDPSITDIKLNSRLAGRVYSTMGNPNVLGGLLVLTLPFFGAVILNSKNLINKIIYALLCMPPLITLVLTGSRSAWVSFAVSIMVFVFFKNWKLLPLILVLGFLLIPILPASIYARIQTMFNPNDTSTKYRILIYNSAFSMLKDYWITGVGLGSTVFNGVFRNYLLQGITTVAHAHNLYLHIWLEAGIAAIITFVWFIARVVKKCMINIFNKTNKNINNILIAGVSSIAGIVVMGFADHVWFFNRIMLIFLVVVAIILAGLNILSPAKLAEDEGNYQNKQGVKT